MWQAKVYASIPVALALLSLICAQVAHGLFTGLAKGGPVTIGTATIAPPGSLEAAQTKCKTNKSPEVRVEWTGSASEAVTGYKVELSTSGGGYSVIATLSASQRSYTDTGLAYSTTYQYRVAATAGSWSGVSTAVSLKTLTRSCTAG